MEQEFIKRCSEVGKQGGIVGGKLRDEVYTVLSRGTVYIPQETLDKYGPDLIKKLNGGDPEIVVVE